MKAFTLSEYIGPAGLRLIDVPVPKPTEGHLVLDIHAIGVNFPDVLMTQGKYQHRPVLPVIPGCEIAGTIVSAPVGSGWEQGDRAAAFVWDGGFAEQARAPLNSVTKIPDFTSLESAAGTVVNYHTVHFALARRGRVQAGETVLVMGAAGGIGTAAVQVAIGLGAHVIAGVANDGQIAVAEAAGAHEAFVLEPGFAGVLREKTGGRGVDVVVDPLGGWLFDEAIRGLAPEARLLVVGFAAGQIPTVKVNRLLLRNVGVLGVAFGAFLDLDPGLMARQGESLDRMTADGIVLPQVCHNFAFEDLPTALEMLSQGRISGKAVVTVKPENSRSDDQRRANAPTGEGR